MNCDRCPHMAKIKAALAPCQNCDAGKLAGTCHVAEDKMDVALRKHAEEEYAARRANNNRIVGDDGGATDNGCGRCTSLTPGDEEKLRRAMVTLFGLDPIDLLLVQHIFAGKSLASFGDTMIAVERKIKRYHGTIRSMAHAKKDAICEIFPQIEPLFTQLVDENDRPSTGGSAR